MSGTKALFVSDGKHDVGAPEWPTDAPWAAGGVVTILARKVAPTISEGSIALKWASLSRWAKGKTGYAAKVRAAQLVAARYGCDAVICVADQDKKTDRLEALQAGATPPIAGARPTVCGVAIESIEAWTLGAREALAAELEIEARALDGLCRPAQVEALYQSSDKPHLRPKDILADAAKLARRGDSLGLREAIAERTDPAALERACPRGFAPFAAALRQTFGADERGP